MQKNGAIIVARSGVFSPTLYDLELVQKRPFKQRLKVETPLRGTDSLYKGIVFSFPLAIRFEVCAGDQQIPTH